MTNFPLHLYQKADFLGKGSFGYVHEYRLRAKVGELDDNELPATVAAKFLGKTREQVMRDRNSKRELQIMNSLQHENIVRFYGSCELGNREMGLVMERCKGDLYQLMLQHRRRFQLDEIRVMVKQIAKGVQYLHVGCEGRLIHRDLKPSNVLIQSRKPLDWAEVDVYSLQLKLADFGLCRFIRNTNPANMTRVYTPRYVAPEVLRGEANYGMPVDIYAVGLISYELQFGCEGSRSPGGDMAVPETSDARFDDFLRKTLQFRPEKRPDANSMLKHPFLQPKKVVEQRKPTMTYPPPDILPLSSPTTNMRPNFGGIHPIINGAHKDISVKDERLSYGRQQSNTSSSSSGQHMDELLWQRSNDNDLSAQIIVKLGLETLYPQKLTLSKVLASNKEKAMSSFDIAWTVLNKIFTLNYKGRNQNILPTPASSYTSGGHSDDEDSSVNSSINLVDRLLLGCHQRSPSCFEIHPMDAIVAIFLCSNNFLRQVLVEKLFLCKLSIPFLLPNPIDKSSTLLLWSFSNIVACDETGTERSILSQPTRVVSFCRVGDFRINISKSKMLNEIIGVMSNQVFNNFYYREMPNGEIKQQLTRGLADVMWYLPSVRNDDSCYTKITAFINLHGNAVDHANQFQFLGKISNLMVVMVSMEDLQKSDVKLFLQRASRECKKVLYFIGYGPREPPNSKEILSDFVTLGKDKVSEENIIIDMPGAKKRPENVLEMIENNLESKTRMRRGEKPKTTTAKVEEETIRLSECCQAVATSCNLGIDTNDPDCKRGLDIAEKLMWHVKGPNCELSEIKKRQLPLQGELWLQWVALEKKKHREIKVGEDDVDLQNKMRNLRIKQGQLCKNLPPLMNDFLEVFLHNLENEDVKMYILKALKLGLDEHCRSNLPDLHKSYNEKWIVMQKLKAESSKSKGGDKQLDKMQGELNELEKRIVSASFGLEHILREMGQIFQAVQETSTSLADPKLLEMANKLPIAMARMLLSGQPMEIMDGDASHVPLSWVKTVLQELKAIVGNKTIFVLSILGLQSSGKSTLLNAMFGLQFAVSAGRCTRGVYAQLIPVPKDPDMVTKCDYILVIDTEGLRAPQLGSETFQHDHEIATFVIGLADITIINLKGENRAEMQDVLQIVVHAFLRFWFVNKSARLKPSCIFVHQNVNAVDADYKLTPIQQSLMNHLNNMTKAAAEQTSVWDISTFQQVINFDFKKHIKYFSDLWYGSPPMAPTNHHYSQDVRNLKKTLFEEIKNKSTPCSTISGCFDRVHDLWNGILSENFVFSFKNSIEIRAYMSLEQRFGELTYKMQNECLKLQNSARNEIESDPCLSYPEDNLVFKISDKIEEIFQEVTAEFDSFIENSNDKEVKEQWREKTFLRLKDEKETRIRKIRNDICSWVELKRLLSRREQDIEEFKRDVLKIAKDTAINLQQQQLGENDLLKKFDNLWENCVQRMLPRNMNGPDEVDVRQRIIHLILQKLQDNQVLVRCEMEKLNKPLKELHESFTVKDIMADDILSVASGDMGKISKATDALASRVSERKQFENKLMELINAKLSSIDDHIKTMQDCKFDEAHATTVINMAISMYSEANETIVSSFRVTSNFKVRFVIHVFRFALHWFKKYHTDYENKTDPRRHLDQNYKGSLYSLFKNIYKQSTQELLAAETFAECFQDKIQEAVQAEMPGRLADDICQKLSCFHSKKQLEKHVLEAMIESPSFVNYKDYVNDSGRVMKRYIRKFANVHFFGSKNELGETRYAEVEIVTTNNLIHNIELDFMAATVEHSDTSNWLKVFHEAIRCKIPIPLNAFDLVAKETCITDLEFFRQCVQKELHRLREELNSASKRKACQDVPLGKGSLYEILEGKCLGCCEQCPFCKVQCSLTIPNHDVRHSATQHYPQGLGRYRFRGGDNEGRMVSDNCCSYVSSNKKFRNQDTGLKWHPYNEYEKVYPRWEIQKDASMKTDLYWKWVYANFDKEWAKEYDADIPQLPESWYRINVDQVRQSIRS